MNVPNVSGGCYTAINDEMTVKEAEASCQVEKAHIAVPEDRDDLNFFGSIGAKKRFWLGASSAAGNGWQTMGGMPFNASVLLTEFQKFINTLYRYINI